MCIEVALLAVTEESERWAQATLSPLVDRIIALLRHEGIVHGDLYPPGPPLPKHSTAWVHSVSPREVIPYPVKREERQHPLKPAAKGAIDAYLEMQPVFEAIYDRWGIDCSTAMRCDSILLGCYMKHGPGKKALRLATMLIDRACHEQVVWSFEHQLEQFARQMGYDVDEGDAGGIEMDVRWPWDKMPQPECSWGPRFYVRPMAWPTERPDTGFPETHGQLSLTFCDECGRRTTPLLRTRKGEFCRDCMAEKGRPLYGWMHNGELDNSVLYYG